MYCLSDSSPSSLLYSTYAHPPLSALFISVAFYLKQKVNKLEPEGTRPRTDTSTTGFKKSSVKCLILVNCHSLVQPEFLKSFSLNAESKRLGYFGKSK